MATPTNLKLLLSAPCSVQDLVPFFSLLRNVGLGAVWREDRL